MVLAHFKNISQKSESSPNRGEHKKCLKPPLRNNIITSLNNNHLTTTNPESQVGIPQHLPTSIRPLSDLQDAESSQTPSVILAKVFLRFLASRSAIPPGKTARFDRVLDLDLKAMNLVVCCWQCSPDPYRVFLQYDFVTACCCFFFVKVLAVDNKHATRIPQKVQQSCCPVTWLHPCNAPQ